MVNIFIFQSKMNRLIPRLFSFSTYQKRSLFEVGSTINLKYMNGFYLFRFSFFLNFFFFFFLEDAEYTLKPDTEYPEWVFQLHKPVKKIIFYFILSNFFSFLDIFSIFLDSFQVKESSQRCHKIQEG